ncbi:CoA transferase [Actinocorallia sp. API 0066]|uniref:CaiB/BaiF CoA transferase family protein n=1 Tax=Actinocorallia sp. API 0066 TaxID=2896846 RepID=UPI001E371B7D|nr:CoA transferase [Actinocorallia sp. API 0066]MCD0452950.1 CoA transferase [Actinocorallia sp. API 0066]
MQGVRVLEVAQFTFVPSAGAVLADWGADVIKIEHAEKGDAQRGLVKVFGQSVVDDSSTFAPIMDGPNRGKRSLGLALEKPEAKAILAELIRSADVFLTNFLPNARIRLGIDIDDVRAINPEIVYASGTSFAHSGPEADSGGYDGTAFWARAGNADSSTPPGYDRVISQPGGAFGDNIGGMTIAGGIAAALFARGRGQGAPTVDISLLGVGAWANQLNVNMALLAGKPLPKYDPRQAQAVPNPLSNNYLTADGRWLSLIMLQPGRYWADFCEKVGHPELATDERFDTAQKLTANSAEAVEIIKEIIGRRSKDAWVKAFAEMEGQWSVVQNNHEVGNDPALHAVGQIADVVDAEGRLRKLVASPVQFDREPITLKRAPQFAEHTDEILRELGVTDEELINLKIAGAVT